MFVLGDLITLLLTKLFHKFSKRLWQRLCLCTAYSSLSQLRSRLGSGVLVRRSEGKGNVAMTLLPLQR